MRKFVVKADPDVLGEFCLGLLARFLIRIMHKVLSILKQEITMELTYFELICYLKVLHASEEISTASF